MATADGARRAMTVAWWAVPSGVMALALCELAAWALGRRRAHPPGVAPRTRLAVTVLALAVAGGVTALLGLVVSLPIGDTIGLAAAGAAAVAVVSVVLLSLAGAASRS